MLRPILLEMLRTRPRPGPRIGGRRAKARIRHSQQKQPRVLEDREKQRKRSRIPEGILPVYNRRTPRMENAEEPGIGTRRVREQARNRVALEIRKADCHPRRHYGTQGRKVSHPRKRERRSMLQIRRTHRQNGTSTTRTRHAEHHPRQHSGRHQTHQGKMGNEGRKETTPGNNG